jgi:hypothetical protein
MTTLPKSEWRTMDEWIPINDVVCLVDPQHRSPLSPSIIEPDIAKRGRYETATVFSVGPQVERLKPGDVVIIPEPRGDYPESRGERVEMDGKVFLFYRECAIPGKVEDK